MTSGDPGLQSSGLSPAPRHVEVHSPTAYGDLCPPDIVLTQLTIRVMDDENVRFDRIGIVLADHDIVTDLNRRYLDHDRHTDVLSFRLNEESPLEGEVYVDVETAMERCDEFEATATDEILRYVVHGLLHLAGYDDGDIGERDQMRDLEDRYLAGITGGE